MDYSSATNQALEYIESHINEDISAEKIAAQVGYSVFHFGRVFAICRGMPLMDYVRARRLTLARTALKSGRKVIDVAMDCGFDTPGGFAKAFRREFGINPGRCRPEGNINNNMEELKNMDVRFETKEAFKVAGYGIETDVTSGYTRDIGAYWDKYDGDNLECKMYAKLCPPKHGEVGICVPRGKNGRAEYVLGVIVKDYSNVEPDMRTVDVPGAMYAVFTTPKASDNCDALAIQVRATWRFVFENWFARGEYEYDQNALDFELYDERCHAGKDAIAEIWVPIKRI